MYYELMRTDTHNVYGEYDSLAEAYAAVRDAVESGGEEVARVLLLSEADPEGDGTLVASGRTLLHLAFERTLA